MKLFEVGTRDGLQNEAVTFDVATRVEFVERLVAAGVRNIEVGAFVSPKWVPQMAHSAEVLRELNRKKKLKLLATKSNLVSLVPNIQGFEDAVAAGAQEIAVFTAASETFSLKNTNASIKESLERIKQVMKRAKEEKVRVRGYLSTCYFCPFEGRIRESKVLSVTEKLLDLGVYEVSIGDTIGAATPNQVRSLNQKLIRLAGRKKLAMHFHDTRGTALANILVSLEMGILTFDSSLGGLGGCPYAPGAAGNVATEDVVYMLHGLGVQTGYDLQKLRDVNEWAAKKVNHVLRGARPFVATPTK